jgi:integrase
MARRGSGEGSIFQRKDGLWQASLELGKGPNGKRQRKTLYGNTKRQVLAKLGVEQEALRKGLSTSGPEMTVGAWLDKWLDSLEPTGLKASTVRNYRDVVNFYVRPQVGYIRLGRLTPEDVEKMVRALAEAGRSTNTQRIARTVLRRSLNQALRRGYVSRNVVSLTDPPAVKVNERPVLTAGQVRLLLATLHDDWLLALYTVTVHTGIRQGEALALRWCDVDLASATVTVAGTLDRSLKRRTEPKTEKSKRTLALTPQAVEALKAQRDRQTFLGTQGSDGLVFTSSKGTPLFDTTVRRHWKVTAAKLGLPEMHWHDLRHSAATIMLAQGVPIEVVSRVLGHASIRITADVYGHVSPETHRDAAKAMEKAMSNASS